MRKHGVVKWFNDSKGYGFLKSLENGRDVFVHYMNIESAGFKTLCEDQEVIFELSDNADRVEAVKVRKVLDNTTRNEPKRSE